MARPFHVRRSGKYLKVADQHPAHRKGRRPLYYQISIRETLDFLRKSGLDGDAVAACGKKIDPKVKPATSVPVRLHEDTEDFEPPLGHAPRAI